MGGLLLVGFFASCGPILRTSDLNARTQESSPAMPLAFERGFNSLRGIPSGHCFEATDVEIQKANHLALHLAPMRLPKDALLGPFGDEMPQAVFPDYQYQGGGVALQGSFDWNQTLVARLDMTVLSHEVKPKDRILTAAALRMLAESGQTDFFRFCGDEVITSARYGRHLSAWIEVAQRSPMVGETTDWDRLLQVLQVWTNLGVQSEPDFPPIYGMSLRVDLTGSTLKVPDFADDANPLALLLRFARDVAESSGEDLLAYTFEPMSIMDRRIDDVVKSQRDQLASGASAKLRLWERKLELQRETSWGGSDEVERLENAMATLDRTGARCMRFPFAEGACSFPSFELGHRSSD